jgi:hypothetical protein
MVVSKQQTVVWLLQGSGRMKRLFLVAIPVSMLCLANAAQSVAASPVASECKTGIKEAKIKIKAMSNRATKRQAQTLAKEASTDMKSGEYQNCVNKLEQIRTLTH